MITEQAVSRCSARVPYQIAIRVTSYYRENQRIENKETEGWPMLAAQSDKIHYRPFGLLAELTYRCPLHCPYCSNPVQLLHTGKQLTTEEWKHVIREAIDL